MAGDRAELVAEVNRLYWETDQPVTELAERLGISRRTIYDMIEPLPVDEPCPECGGPLTYASRSARMSGEALCGLCGKTQDLTLLRELSSAARAKSDVRSEPPGERHPEDRAAPSAGARAEPERAVPAAAASTAVAHRPPTTLAPARPIPRRPSPALTTLLVGTLIITVLAALLLPRPARRRRW